jgi:hypothetical protein
MARRRTSLMMAMLAAAGLLIALGSLQPDVLAQEQQKEAAHDLEVTVQLMDGTKLSHGKEITQLELILDANGGLDQVHLITRAGAEADTHIWYNVRNLVSVQYRFLSITGKGKVRIRTLQRPELEAPEAAKLQRVRPLLPEDFR